MLADEAEDDGAVPIIVKNTFIQVGAPSERLPRRSSSLPPSMKSEGETALSESPAPSGKPFSTASPTKGSTGTKSLAFHDRIAATGPAPSSAAYSPEINPSEEIEARTLMDPEGLTPTDIDAWAPRLNSCAVPFQPRVPRPVMPQGLQPASFSEMLKNTVMTLTSMIMTTFQDMAVKVQAIESFQCWLVDAQVGSTDCVAQVLEHAKASLLLLAERSTHVYVMGYRTKPFQEKTNAFQATIGIMQDQSLACWDVYSAGYCRRGSCCRWQHPACTKNLVVAARPELGGQGAMDVKALIPKPVENV